MDIYADLPSANTGSENPDSSGSSAAPSSSSAAPKGSWAHSKFQGMIAKRRTATAAATSRMAPPPVKRPGLPTAVVVRSKEKVETSRSKPKANTQASTPAPPTSRPKSWDMGFGDVEDDYDPSHPNDYMEYCRERIARKKQEERDRELKIIMEEQERERKRLDEERAATIRKIQEAAAKAHEAGAAAGGGGAGGGGADREGGTGGPGTSGAAAAAAAVGGDIAALEVSMGRGRGRGLSNLPAWMTKGAGGGAAAAGVAAAAAAKDDPSPEGLQEPPTPGRRKPPPSSGQFENASEGRLAPPPARGIAGIPGGSGAGARAGSLESGMNFAERMMAKMGHKEGQGLGASRQGISQPLQSLSAGGGMGVIDLHQADKKRLSGGMEAPPVPPARKKRGLFSNPTRVLLLKNMVGPGEVDDDLEGETQGECERFGPVRRCIIYEMKGGDTPDSERVRIFVAFEKQESAVKAYLEMNGRFFGGRQIAASFYKEDKFDSLDLEPQLDEEKS